MGIATRMKIIKHSFVIAVCLSISLLLSGCRKKEGQAVQASEAPAVQVKVVEVRAEPFHATVAVTGTLVSRALVVVKAEIIGRLVKFSKQEGDPVTAGEAVAWVDDENYRLAMQQAQAAVQVAEASLARTRVTAEHNKLELARAHNLIQSGGITDQDLQAADAAERDARAQVALAEAQLVQSKAALEVAAKKLRDTVIRAPVGGVIEQKFVNPGAYVEAPTQVFGIVDNQRLELESPVPAAQLGQVRSGQKVTFAVNSYPGTVFEGQVIEVNPAVDTLTRSAKLRIGVNNSSSRLKAGMFAQGEILTGIQQQAIVIPAVAVYRGAATGDDAHVFVVENNKAVERSVRIGRETDGRLEIVSGLKPGDVLIAEQRIELASGVSVAAGK